MRNPEPPLPITRTDTDRRCSVVCVMCALRSFKLGKPYFQSYHSRRTPRQSASDIHRGATEAVGEPTRMHGTQELG